MLHVGISQVYIPSLLYGCLLYASLVTGYGCLWLRVSCHSNPTDSECDVFWEKRSKNYFCDNGGFKILFRPFSTSIFRTCCAIPAFRSPLWESWAPFQLVDFFLDWVQSTACVLDVSSRNGWVNVIEIGPKVYVR
jgi:hypothetical protein